MHQDSWGEAQTNSYNGSTQDLFNDTVVAICEEYHIEYFNLFTLCPVNHKNYTYWYLQDNTQGIWIHPNNRLNTVIFNQILSRNSNNGYCYPGNWTDCSEKLASPTQHSLFTPVIANIPYNMIRNAIFFKNYQSTSFFNVCSNNGSKVLLRLSLIAVSNDDDFGQEQIAYRELGGTEKRLCLFSRQKNKTSITFELEEGIYQFAFYNTKSHNLCAVNFKLEVLNGYVAPYDYSFKPSNLVQKHDLKIHFLRNSIEVIGSGLQIAQTGEVISGTTLLVASNSFELDPDDNPFIYFVTANDIKICQWKNNALVALDKIDNNLRISTAGSRFSYRNIFNL